MSDNPNKKTFFSSSTIEKTNGYKLLMKKKELKDQLFQKKREKDELTLKRIYHEELKRDNKLIIRYFEEYKLFYKRILNNLYMDINEKEKLIRNKILEIADHIFPHLQNEFIKKCRTYISKNSLENFRSAKIKFILKEVIRLVPINILNYDKFVNGIKELDKVNNSIMLKLHILILKFLVDYKDEEWFKEVKDIVLN